MLLPHEILREIIMPPLLVPDALFADTSVVSPFTTVTRSSSDVLLVCKQWMRVATPWLYETVVLRSMAQAQALELALASHPEFGKYIKKIRVEGAYGDYIHTIASLSPNLRDLAFTLTVWHNDPIDGLTAALDLLNPARVILTLGNSKSPNQNQRILTASLAEAIPAWTKLEEFSFAQVPGGPDWGYRSERRGQHAACPQIMKALLKSTALRFVSLWAISWGNCETLDSDIVKLASAPNMRRVTLDQDERYQRCNFERMTRHLPPALRQRLDYTGKGITAYWESVQPAPRPVAEQLPNPFYKPMAGAQPKDRAAVWRAVFRFAVAVPSQGVSYEYSSSMYRHKRIWRGWFDTNLFGPSTSHALMLTSREFRNIMLSVLVSSIRLERDSRVPLILRRLKADPTLSNHMVEVTDLIGVGAAAILAITPMLRECTTTGTTLVLETLGHVAGRSLQKLTIRPWGAGPVCPDLYAFSMSSLRPFGNLRELHWDVDCRVVEVLCSAEPISLDRLTDLKLSSVHGNPAFLDGMANTRLPSLVALEIRTTISDEAGKAFLNAHGRGLHRVSVVNEDLVPSILEACPNLVSLAINERNRKSLLGAEGIFTAGNTRLQTVKLGWECSRKQRRDLDVWEEVFNQFTRATYPGMSEIQLAAAELWPQSQREEAKNPWVKFAEALAERDIGLSDSTGRVWRTRLKLRPSPDA